VSEQSVVNRGEVQLKSRQLEPRAGNARWWFGGLALIKLTSEDTGGRSALIEMLYPPQLPVPLHRHNKADEVFLLLEGEVDFQLGEKRFVSGPGSVIFVEKGTPHCFTVISNHPARYMITYTPAGFEGFILEASEPARTLTLPPPAVAPPSPDTMAKLDKLMAERYATEPLVRSRIERYAE
jgi:quercetin dioxygenase-like cupin family protein